MDLQTIFDNAMIADRAEKMKSSPQLTLGEILLKLEAIIEKDYKGPDGSEPEVKFDFEYTYPDSIDSWRGIYAELAIGFSMYKRNEEYIPFTLKKFYEMLKVCIGKTFTGYKGGDFVMGKATPVWVANYGNSGHTAVVDILDEKYDVIITTKYLSD